MTFSSRTCYNLCWDNKRVNINNGFDSCDVVWVVKHEQAVGLCLRSHMAPSAALRTCVFGARWQIWRVLCGVPLELEREGLSAPLIWHQTCWANAGQHLANTEPMLGQRWAKPQGPLSEMTVLWQIQALAPPTKLKKSLKRNKLHRLNPTNPANFSESTEYFNIKRLHAVRWKNSWKTA